MSRKPKPLARASVLVTGMVLLQALLVMWFAWPTQKAAPRDLPVIVAGSTQATAAVVDQLRTARPGAFDIYTVPDATAADADLRSRFAYAAFIVEPTGVSLHVASAASPTVSNLVSQAAREMDDDHPVTVTDVVASPVDDPRGAGLSAAFLPLLLTSLACGVALLFLVRSHRLRVAGQILFAVLAGGIAAGAMHGIGVLTGSYLATAGAIALLALAVSATVAGLGAVLGKAGIGLGALLVFFSGNPISGLATAPELLPAPWGTIGHFLPPGAGAGLLRSVAFFDGAGAAQPLWILVNWAAAGLVLTALGHFRDRATPPVSAVHATGNAVTLPRGTVHVSAHAMLSRGDRPAAGYAPHSAAPQTRPRAADQETTQHRQGWLARTCRPARHCRT
ncbi:hypothetical protein [Catellatospora citrea]|uniref:Membrane protein n=1 Tax=Catellatospora citrea TaxID=53366 RepID=A0A8J3KHR5_9ACTN|nr:hypothetical protein [Catellatospora citrea]RKE11926.1 hypothetical protein C8E86_6858 [Catellatospora citrea]GIG00262.1 membrane protein [Catellatospora citrea]